MKHQEEFTALFSGFTKAFGQYILGDLDTDKNKLGGDARTSYAAIAEENWTQHLIGKKTGLGIIPLKDDNQHVNWCCIDVDIYKDLSYEGIEKKITGAKLPAVLTLSKSGGMHIWFFFSEPANAAAAQQKLKSIASFLGFAKHEIFPKQTQRAGATDTGNWINLPYFGNTRKGYKDGKSLTLSEFLPWALSQRTTLAKFVKLKIGGQGKHFVDGPPCLQQLAFEGFQDQYNNSMLNCAIYFKHRDPATWQSDFIQFNQQWEKPMNSADIQKLADSVNQKDYSYTCNKPPLCDYCNYQQCKGRQYGINIFKGTLQVQIDSITKYKSEPPIWVVEMEGKRILINQSKILMSASAFNQVCFDNFNRLLPAIKAGAWIEYINDLMLNKLTEVPAPVDASNKGQLLSLLDTFISDRVMFGEEKKDLMLQGNVWVSPDRVAYFQSGALMKYLRTQGFTFLSTAEVWATLTDNGAESGEMKLKGKRIAYWTYPAGNLQTEKFSTPDYESEESF